MTHKVLIANRGEIALRALRACKELGILTVAVYSSADKDLKHLRFADESVCIGPAQPLNSYLNIPAILSAAELTEVNAIYPGYGFLAEDADFAEKCEKSGFKFIGPSAEIIRQMGDKITAKYLAESAGIQTVPGYKEDIPEDEGSFKKIAADIGYPIMIKATAGGGGRGMRIVKSENELISSAQITMQEAKNAFGNEKIYLEKFIENPRHVEVQVVGDGKGNAIHLGTRDCSMQRRHQKIIEEAPALNLNEDSLRETLDACINLCKKIKYEGAGTLEFLYENNEFYFIEMNTRIQVEHPITEEINGCDLIKEQIRIAAGEKLSEHVQNSTPRQHSIECRINAEDPYNNFMPSPGKIDFWFQPGGRGVRVDTHVYSGYQVPPYYDSMIAKLIVTGATREIAIDRTQRALNEFLIEGIKTTIPFQDAIIKNSDFRSGNYNIGWVEEFLNDLK